MKVRREFVPRMTPAHGFLFAVLTLRRWGRPIIVRRCSMVLVAQPVAYRKATGQTIAGDFSRQGIRDTPGLR